MTTRELETIIKEYIELNYQAKYIAKLKVVKLNPGYELRLDLFNWMVPMTLQCDFEKDTDFLDYVFKEIKSSNFMRVEYSRLNLTKNSSNG